MLVIALQLLIIGECPLSHLSATRDDPIYTTYAAQLGRSEYYVDEGYHLRFYTDGVGVNFETDNAGNLCFAWKLDHDFRVNVDQFHQQPVIEKSYSDIVVFHFKPYPELSVKETFLVYSSRIAIQHLQIKNISPMTETVYVYPLFQYTTGQATNVLHHANYFTFSHHESVDWWTQTHIPGYVEDFNDVYMLSVIPDYWGGYTDSWTSFYGDATNDHSLDCSMPSNTLRCLAFQKDIVLTSGESFDIRIIRGVQKHNENILDLVAECKSLMDLSFEPFIAFNESLYQSIPVYTFANPDQELMYWSAFNLVRQMMLPPEGECSYNYYVYSREPTWGWGHAGQVFHESLSMLVYAFMDPISAMNSQRVYMERQWSNGYIPYRTGPYLNETIPWGDKYTSSAPWFSWENWEIYKISRDTVFLEEAYEAGASFYFYWINNRDKDSDGLYEWGGHGVLESVRDGLCAIWDRVGWPSNFECLDLNCMLVKEAKALALMAQELGYSEDYEYWTGKADTLTNLINEYMWDTETHFYYHIDRVNHTFSFNRPDDLKRQEIIGFLPLWAGVANQEQSNYLVEQLTDTDKFWRNYGVPTLSAEDPYYDPMGYWNGPVWVQWEYLIFRGLLDYGFVAQAESLAAKVFDNVIYQLKKNHWFWELYCPDYYAAGHHRAYIWTCLVARMIIDLKELTGVKESMNQKEYKTGLLWISPNPANKFTLIQYMVPYPQFVTLKIYNLDGTLIRTLTNKYRVAGSYAICWDLKTDDGKDVTGGTYFCRLKLGESIDNHKIIVIK